MKATWPPHFERFFRGLISVGADLQAGAAGGGTEWKALCPAHDDSVHSLSIARGHDGRLVIRCHAPANCAAAEICAAVGCTVRDLYPDEEDKRREREARLARDAALAAGTSSRYVDDAYRDAAGRSEVERPAAAAAIPEKFLNRPRPHSDPNQKAKGKKMSTTGPARVVKAYDYRDENGALLFQVCRTDPKGFRQRRPNPSFDNTAQITADNQPWIWNIRDTRIVLYNLPDMLAAWKDKPARAVFVVEGEKDADLLKAAGLLSTTMPGGVFKWRPEYTAFLKGRHVVVIPDEDPIREEGYSPGIKHATEVCNALLGAAASVRMLRLPGVPPGGDFSDWWALNQTPGENGPSIEETKKKFGGLVVKAPEWAFDPTHRKAGEPDAAANGAAPSIPGTVTPATAPAVPAPVVTTPAPVVPPTSPTAAPVLPVVTTAAAAAKPTPEPVGLAPNANVQALFAHGLAAAEAMGSNGVTINSIAELFGMLRLGLGKMERALDDAVFNGRKGDQNTAAAHAVGVLCGVLVLASANCSAPAFDKPAG